MNIRNTLVCSSVVAFLLISITTCTGQKVTTNPVESVVTNHQTKIEKINELMSIYADYGKFSGSVLVADQGEIIYKEGFGLANVEWDIPNQSDTKFRIASVSKQFTAMLIMQLVAEGKLGLDSVVTTYLSDYPKAVGDKVNLHQLLTHTSGIPNYTSFKGYWDMMSSSMNPDDLIEVFKDSTLMFTPGQRFSYSNSGYVLLGAIIEKVTGQSYEDVLQEKILTPLKMNDTGYDSHRTVLKNRAAGYDKNADVYEHARFIDMSVAYSAGGLYSTVEDMFLWDQALYTSTLLPEKYMTMIFSRHIPAWGQDYGYGWNVGEMNIGNTQEKIEAVHHDGVINGFNSIIIRIPSAQSSIVLLNNAGGAPLYEMSKSIIGILYDRSYDFPKQSVAHTLLKAIDAEGIENGMALYNKIKDSSSYHLDEREMNMISYELLKDDQTDAAIEVLKLGLEQFPNAFNLYDSYGEILRSVGKEKEAINSYTKSVQLNPKNENGIKMLAELGVDINPQDLYLLKTDNSWQTEIFVFPLHFAEGLKYQGTEEAHFPKGWRKTDNPEFWSYTYAWNIDLITELSTTELASNLQTYFDGLMKVVNRKRDFTIPKSVANLTMIEGNNTLATYTGTLTIHDAFVTEESIRLNVKVDHYHCQTAGKSILVFKFSPKPFGTEIWDELDGINLRSDYCPN